MTTPHDSFEAHLKAMPEWAPEFEVHRPWVEKLLRDAWDASLKQSSAVPDLPPHPEPHSHTWSELEKRAILAWGVAMVRAARNRALDDAYNVVFDVPGSRVVRFDVQTAIRELKEKIDVPTA